LLAQVRLQEYGSKLIEVADNGGGIAPADHPQLALKYTTSKLANFDDLMVSSQSIARSLQLIGQ
jgi:DNA mismatch repair protein PMS2